MSASKASLVISNPSPLVKHSLCLTDKYAVAATEDGEVIILGTECRHFNQEKCEHRRRIFTTVISHVACMNDLLVIGHVTGVISLYSLESTVQITNLAGSFSPIRLHHSISPLLLLSSSAFSQELKVWNVESADSQRMLTGHEGETFCAVSTDALIITGSEDTTVRVWSLDEGSGYLKALEDFQEPVRMLCFSGDHEKVAAALDSGRIGICNIYDETCIQTEGHINTVTQLKAIDNTLISASIDGCIKIWNILDGTLYDSFQAHNQAVQMMIWADDNQHMISIGREGSFKVWKFSDNGLSVLGEFRGKAAVIGQVVSRDGMVVIESSIPGHRTSKQRLLQICDFQEMIEAALSE